MHQRDKRTDDYKMILNLLEKLMKNKIFKNEKKAGKGPNVKKLCFIKPGYVLCALSSWN